MSRAASSSLRARRSSRRRRLASLAAGLAAACTSPPGGEPGGSPRVVVIEAETPAVREPNDGSFARAHYAPWASERHCALRFYGDGRATYLIDVPADGTWSLWLRYAATSPVRLRAGFLPEAGVSAATEVPEHQLESTGALSGKYAWAWKRLQRAELVAGQHRFVLHGAPLRPDCLLLTRSDEPPTYLDPTAPAPLDEQTRAALARPLVSFPPNWWQAAADYRLPAWFDGSRVSLHTRLTDRMRAHHAFDTAEQHFAALGVRSLVRHVKSAGEGAWWPSAHGVVEPWARDGDVVRAMIARAHAQGLSFIAYYRHMEDAGMAERHPEWVARDDRGRAYLRRRDHPMLCFSTPYADFVEARLLELVERGADGFYFDELHMPRHGCWCAACVTGFRASTGLAPPVRVDEEDPLYRKFLEYRRVVIECTFARWRSVLHARDPDVVLLVSSADALDLLERLTSARILNLSDSVKTEFDKGASSRAEKLVAGLDDVRLPTRGARLALGWTIARDAADGRPPHVWIPRLEMLEQALHATAGVVTHGGVANLDHGEDSIPDAARFAPAIALAESVGPSLAGLRPLRWVALHVPERGLERREPDDERAWREVIGPLTGAFELLLEEHLPVGVVTDLQLAAGRLEGYRALFLPAPEDLSETMRAEVARFARRGGRVIHPDPAWNWNAPAEHGAARDGLLAALRSVPPAPFELEGVPPHVHAVAFTDAAHSRLLVALANDFAWVHTTRQPTTSQPPELVRDITLRLTGERTPLRVRELVTGRTLDAERGAPIALPELRAALFVSIEWAP